MFCEIIARQFLEDLIIFKASLQHNTMQLAKTEELTENLFVQNSLSKNGMFSVPLAKLNKVFIGETQKIVKRFTHINGAGKIFSQQMAGEPVSYL